MNHKFYKPFFKLLQTISFSHEGSGVAKQVPLIITSQKRVTLPKGAQQHLLLGLFLLNHHVAGAKA